MSEDREVIKEGLLNRNEKQNAKLAEGAKIINGFADREFEVGVNFAKKIGCI